MESMKTVPVNQSCGPAAVRPPLRVSFMRAFLSVVLGTSGSEREQHLRGAALVHSLVPLGGLIERQGEVEDLAWVDLAVPDELDQLGQEPTHRGGAAEDLHLGEEQQLT